jgi:predicted O-methyltransferase YrrM
MDYRTFLGRFGGSLRTKNLNSPLEPIWKKTARNLRSHWLPTKSELPPEFIRQDPWEAEYLYILAERAKVGIVETGRLNGGSVFLMTCANPDVPIYSIDLSPQDDRTLRDMMTRLGVGSNVDLIVGDSQHVKYPQIKAFDLLFIDGDHSYEGCAADIENWYPDLAPGGHMVLHDSYATSPVMDACIDFIARARPIVHVSPYKHANHSTHPTGSLAHLQKPFG